MNYKVTRNGQQTGKWFDTASDAHDYIEKQWHIEKTMGQPRLSDYRAYYNPTGTQVNREGTRQNEKTMA